MARLGARPVPSVVSRLLGLPGDGMAESPRESSGEKRSFSHSTDGAGTRQSTGLVESAVTRTTRPVQAGLERRVVHEGCGPWYREPRRERDRRRVSGRKGVGESPPDTTRSREQAHIARGYSPKSGPLSSVVRANERQSRAI